ncbi:MAG: hypothetical protein R3F34_17530 [Planctomycetota bacterium]
MTRTPSDVSSSDADRTAGARPADARRALEEFDRGRAEGRDLEGLFKDLERDLGLDSGDDEDPGHAPDFPGVVGAMVEEFVWESERERPGSTAAFAGHLRAFAESKRDIGVFEELAAYDLVDFAARVTIQRDLLGDDTERGADAMLEGLRAFAVWADEAHDLGLWATFERAHAGLLRSLPRVASISRRLQRPVDVDWSPEHWVQTHADGRFVTVGGESYEIEVPRGVDHPNDEDWIVGRVRGRVFVPAAVLPPEAGRLR